MSASPLYSDDRLFPIQSRKPFSWPALAVVLFAHALFLAWILTGYAPSAPAITPPMIGVLVSPASSAGNGQSTGSSPDQPQTLKKTAERQEKRTELPAAGKPQAEKTALTPAEKQTATDTAGGKNSMASDTRTDSATDNASSTGKAGGTDRSGGTGAFFSPRVDAAHFNNPKPAYPIASRRMAEEGTVTLSVHILASGKVAEVRLKKSSGYPRLDEAAIQAVKKWRYIPARQGDTPVPCWYTQAVKFSLTD